MKVKFHYKKNSYGPLKWRAHAVVPEIVEGRTQQVMISSGLCLFKWGARRELRKFVRQHINSGNRNEHHEELVDV